MMGEYYFVYIIKFNIINSGSGRWQWTPKMPLKSPAEALLHHPYLAIKLKSSAIMWD
jgi:hypothetical protein